MRTKVSQNAKLMEYLFHKGTITQAEARQVFGVERLASRIHDLRWAGLNITSVPKKDWAGKKYVRYVLDEQGVPFDGGK